MSAHEEAGECTEKIRIYQDEFGERFIFAVGEYPSGRRFTFKCYLEKEDLLPLSLAFEDCCFKAKEQFGAKCLHYRRDKDEAATLVIESYRVDSIQMQE